MEPEKGVFDFHWHQCLLVLILAVATCSRFYALDASSLSATELSNLAMCHVSGWWAMAAQYVATTGLPPVYPTAMCHVSDWVSGSDFFVRTPSALAGVISVYLVYLAGNRFLSPAAGLIGAAVLATDLRSIVISQEATIYALLALGLTVNSYCFSTLMFSPSCRISRPVVAGISGNNYHFEWQWMPVFPCDGRFLLGFWCSAILVFYTSTMSWMLFTSELVACLVFRGVLQKGMFRAMWLPVLLVSLFWLPVIKGYGAWVLQGNLFGWQVIPSMQKMMVLAPLNATIQMTQLALAVAAIVTLVVCALGLLGKERCLYRGFLALQLIIAMIAICAIPSSSPYSFLYLLPVVFLLMADVLEIAIRRIPFAALQNCVVIVVVVVIMVFQTRSNFELKLYNRVGIDDFRTAVRILYEDKAFMAGKKIIFTSGSAFAPYLESYGLVDKTQADLKGASSNNVVQNTFANTDFYYLEFAENDPRLERPYPIFQELSNRFNTVCTTIMPHIRVTKFSHDTPQTNAQTADCRMFLPGLPALK
ncbi:MAG TPA: glycosyltransferase family 39 protein [Pseudomonadales bacterium]|nr:glycosyltransferase family 39 protein [Pseudomonadales bacterium]